MQVHVNQATSSLLRQVSTTAGRMVATRAILASTILLSGCVSAINERNTVAHAQAGYTAMNKGDWYLARRQFAQAVVNAELGRIDPDDQARVNYEYGRVLGVTCSFVMSEQYLLRSEALEEQAGKPPYLVLLELGLLNEKQGKNQEAANYYAKLLPLMEQAGLREKYPLGVADVYGHYSSVLEALGRSAEAARARAESDALHLAHPDAMPFGVVTPYGTQCEKSP